MEDRFIQLILLRAREQNADDLHPRRVGLNLSHASQGTRHHFSERIEGIALRPA